MLFTPHKPTAAQFDNDAAETRMNTYWKRQHAYTRHALARPNSVGAIHVLAKNARCTYAACMRGYVATVGVAVPTVYVPRNAQDVLAEIGGYTVSNCMCVLSCPSASAYTLTRQLIIQKLLK